MVNNNLNPTWRPLRVSMASLCHCDEARPLLIEARLLAWQKGLCLQARQACKDPCQQLHTHTHTHTHLPSTSWQVYDHDASGSHDLIGQAKTSVAQLQAAATQGQPLPLVNPRKQGRPGYTSSGAVGWSTGWTGLAAGCCRSSAALSGLQSERSHVHMSVTTVLCKCRRGVGGEERDRHTPPLFPGVHSR